MNTQFFVKFLTVSAVFNGSHHNVFGCHKRQFCHKAAFYHFGIYFDTVRYVQHNIEYRVCAEERFRNGNTLVCAVVKRSLKPLRTRRERGVQAVDHHITSKGSNTFTSHRVALVRHCGRTYLVLLERFCYFLKVLQKTEVV